MPYAFHFLGSDLARAYVQALVHLPRISGDDFAVIFLRHPYGYVALAGGGGTEDD